MLHRSEAVEYASYKLLLIAAAAKLATGSVSQLHWQLYLPCSFTKVPN